MRVLSDKQVVAIWDKAKKKVKVNCDEFHGHSARQGCLSGPDPYIDLCMLCEQILYEHQELRDYLKTIELRPLVAKDQDEDDD